MCEDTPTAFTEGQLSQPLAPVNVLRKPIHDVVDLRAQLQAACGFKLATIPLYLTALYSLREGAAPEVAEIIRSIALEKMLHLNIAANLLYAVGGSPKFTIPSYPGSFPENLGNKSGSRALEVKLGKLSRQQLAIFMQIEHQTAQTQDGWDGDVWTIGELYRSIRDYMEVEGDNVFQSNATLRRALGNSAKQINDTASALKGLDLIIRQGEGSTSPPTNGDENFPHFYRFSEVYNGRSLNIGDDGAINYNGAKIFFDEKLHVYDLIDNASEDMYNNSFMTNARVNEVSKLFNFHFTDMLRCLEVASHDISTEIDECVGLMLVVGAVGRQLVQLEVYNEGEEVIGNAIPLWLMADSV